MLDAKMIKDKAKELGATFCGIGKVYNEDNPQRDPKMILPNAKCIIGFGFIVPKAMYKTMDSQSQFYTYTSIGVKYTDEELAEIFLLKMAGIIENEGYDACLQKSVPNLRITGDKENHHISGAKYAREFLEKYEFDNEKIKLIERCIKNHRGSINGNRETIEEKIISTADAISHIEYPLPLFYTWYGKRQLALEEGKNEIRNKLKRSWKKIEFEYKKEEIKEKYEYLMEVLSIDE